MFERKRRDPQRKERNLVQITVYREDRPRQRRAFDSNGSMGTELHRPVLEFSVTYEAETGEVEVVAERAEARTEFARLCSEHLFRTELGSRAAPPRRFNLSSLLRRHLFPTDPDDGIDEVIVNLLRLKPIDTEAERVTLECLKGATDDIWKMATTRFGAGNPLSGGWRITQAKFTIRFKEKAGSRTKRTLPVTITMPHQCDLREQTERQRLIAGRYLREWDLLADT